jgi:hypothetical protein
MFRRQLAALVLALSIATSGCTSVQLRRNTVRQAESLSDIYEQQVLDNLAMFVHDPNSLPYFAFPTQGNSTLTDQGSVTSSFTWIPGLSSATLTPNVTRTNNEAWTLTPIANPRVLELMRCAYQRAVRSCCQGTAESINCPDCRKRLNAYYTGDPNLAVPSPGSSGDSGIVTSECLSTDPCWFHVACEKCLTKYSKCCRVGHNCGVYVCVPPGRGQDELTKLTLVILDFAVNNAAPAPEAPQPIATQQVVMYLKGDGKTPATRETAERIVTRTENVEPPASMGMLPRGAPSGIYMLPHRDPRPNPSSLPNVLELRQQLRATGVE